MRHSETTQVIRYMSFIVGLFICFATAIKKYVVIYFQRIKPYLIQWHYRIEPVYRFLAKRLVFATYSITASGFENIPKTGAALLISNHISYVDGLIINALSHRRVRFVIDNAIYNIPIIHYFMQLNQAIPISTKKEQINAAMAEISQGLANGDVICIFPEGRLTYTGFMSHFRPGVEWIIQKNPTPIYPIFLDGLWGSLFSRKYQKTFWWFFPRSIRRKIVAICGEAIPPDDITVDQLHIVMLQLRGLLQK